MNNTIAANRDAVSAADAFARPRVSWPSAPCRVSRDADSTTVRPDKRVTGPTGTFGQTTGTSTTRTSTTRTTDPHRLGSPPLWRSN